MVEKNFVENSELLVVNRIKTIWPLITGTPQEATLKNGLRIKYKERVLEGERFLDIIYCVNKNWVTQSIPVETWPVHFGIRRYWTCGCGKRCAVLYMHPERPMAFACKGCLDLNYNLSYLNRNTKNGKILYNFHWLNKLMELQENISRLSYKNKGTRKTIKFIIMSRKLGMMS